MANKLTGIRTLITNNGIRKEYLRWKYAKLTTGGPPSLPLPGGRRVFPAERFNDYHSIARQRPDDAEFRLLQALLGRGGVFVDVGANVGAVSVCAAGTGLVSRVIAFLKHRTLALPWTTESLSP